MSPLRTVTSLVALAVVVQTALAFSSPPGDGGMESCQAVPRYNTMSRAADVVFVVDRSLSMLQAQRWLVDIPELINEGLIAGGVGGKKLNNNFHVFTFGQSPDGRPSYWRRSSFCQNSSTSAYCAKSMLMRIAAYQKQGSYKDGLQAIAYAINNTEFRENTPSQTISRNIILVTDEDRDSDAALSLGITRRSVKKLLKKRNITLTSVVDCSYKDIVSTPDILGMTRILNRTEKDANGKRRVIRKGVVAINDTERSFTYVPNVVLDRSYQNTWKSYASLATEVNGSTWNINLLKQAIYPNTFSGAFVEAIMGVALRDTSEHCCENNCGQNTEVCSTCEQVTNYEVGVERFARQEQPAKPIIPEASTVTQETSPGSF